MVELIAVMVVVSILSAVALPKLFNSESMHLLTAREDLLAALNHAQQLAMARDSASEAVTVVTQSGSVDVRIAGSSVTIGAISYPLQLPSAVNLSPAVTLDYNRLGETSATSLTLTAGTSTASIALEASGYAH